VHDPIARIRVLTEVVWIECPKRLVFFFCHGYRICDYTRR
jgi:hypothetical protein